jgi:hypothetical protein
MACILMEFIGSDETLSAIFMGEPCILRSIVCLLQINALDINFI